MHDGERGDSETKKQKSSAREDLATRECATLVDCRYGDRTDAFNRKWSTSRNETEARKSTKEEKATAPAPMSAAVTAVSCADAHATSTAAGNQETKQNMKGAKRAMVTAVGPNVAGSGDADGSALL